MVFNAAYQINRPQETHEYALQNHTMSHMVTAYLSVINPLGIKMDSTSFS